MSNLNAGQTAIELDTPRFRDLVFDAAGFFHSLASGIGNLGKDNPVQFPQIVVDGLTALPLQSLTPEMRTHVLAYRALLRGTALLIATTLRDLTLSPELDDTIPQAPIVISERFYRHPTRFPQDFPAELPGHLARWLIAAGLENNRATTIANRLPSFFVLGLHEEWAAQSVDYESLVPYFDTPLTSAIESEFAWQRYHISLYLKIYKSEIREYGGIAPVYVRPRAYWEEESELPEGKTIRHVVDLHSQMDKWLYKGDTNDPIRFLVGDWGMGKSSFLKMWASELVERGSHHVLYVPSKLSSPLREGINIEEDDHWVGGWKSQLDRYIAATCNIPQSPLTPADDEVPLLFIFDGFDGFSFVRRVIPESLQGFINEVVRIIGIRNNRKCEVMAVIAGEALSPYIPNPAQTLHILPFKIESIGDAEDAERYDYEGPAALLELDQRDLWWRKRGAATGKNYSGMPEVLRRDLGSKTLRPYLHRQAAEYFEAGRVAPNGSINWEDWDRFTFGDTTYGANEDFSYCDLSHSFLYGAELANANLTCANLSHSLLMKADLTGANLTGADFTGAGLEDANLTGAIVVDVRVGSQTVNDAQSLLALCNRSRFRAQNPGYD